MIFAHQHGVKVYVTANILAHNADIEPVRAYFHDLKKVKPDALIISDPAVFMIAKEILPDMELHVSTRRTIQIMELTISGTVWEQNGLFQPENYPSMRLRRFGKRYRKIWKLRLLCMVQCVFPIREDVCSAVL